MGLFNRGRHAASVVSRPRRSAHTNITVESSNGGVAQDLSCAEMLFLQKPQVPARNKRKVDDMEPFAGGLSHQAPKDLRGKHRIVGGSISIAGHNSDSSTDGDGSAGMESQLVTTDRLVSGRVSSVAASDISTSRRVRRERRNNSAARRKCSEANELLESPGRISRCSLTVYGSVPATPRSPPPICVNRGREKSADRMPPLTPHVHVNARTSRRTMEESNRTRTNDGTEVAEGQFPMRSEQLFKSAGKRCTCRCHSRRSIKSSFERTPTSLGARAIPPTSGPPQQNVDDGREIPSVNQVTATPSSPKIVTGPKQDSAYSTYNTAVIHLINSQREDEHEVSSDHINENRQWCGSQTGFTTLLEPPRQQDCVRRHSCHDSERAHLEGPRSRRQELVDEAESERIMAPNGDLLSKSGSCIREESSMHARQTRHDWAVNAKGCSVHDEAAEISQDVKHHPAQFSASVRRCTHSAPPRLAGSRSQTYTKGFDPTETGLVSREHNSRRVAEDARLYRTSLSVDIERLMDHNWTPSVDQELDAEVYEINSLSSLELVQGDSEFGRHLVFNEYDTGRCVEPSPLAEDSHFATRVTSNSIAPLLTANDEMGKYQRQDTLEAYRGSENFSAQFWRPYKLY